MKSLTRGFQFGLAVAVMLAVATPVLGADAVGEGAPSTKSAMDKLASDLENIMALSRPIYPAGLEAIKECDEAKLKQVLDELRWFENQVEEIKHSIEEIQGPPRSPDNPYGKVWASADEYGPLFTMHIEDLTRKWEAAKRECDKQHPTTAGGGAITPGSDVAKGHVVFVDPKTQQPIPGGQVVVIPKDPQKPIPPPVQIGQNGTAEIPSHGPDDTIIFLPQCHQKMTTTGSQVDGNTGVQVATVSHALTFIADAPCSTVNAELVGNYLQSQGMKLSECEKGAWPAGDFSRGTGRPGDPYEVREEYWSFFPPRYKCVITIHCYERSSRAVAENACAVPIPGGGTGIPTNTGTGKPTDGGTTTIHVEGDQPREIQGPAPTEPYAKSKSSWGQSYPDQWALRAINWLRADGTTVLPAKGAPVIVAVIDTGVDIWHPDLLGAAWINAELLKKGKLERDSKGFYGDFLGWNFVDGNNDISDKNGHGTVIAGIIAAGVGKEFGIAGINPWARIMPLKIMEINGKGGSINLARAVLYAVDHGARVINLSVGGERLTVTEQAALDYAAEKGVVVVVASGNQGINTADFSPAGLRNALTVAALGPDLKRPTFSNWGSTIAIAAPGVDILSLRARQTDLLMFDKPDYKPGTAVVGERYYRITGSSFAAPMVSGAASLLFSARPELTGEQVKRMLVQSARNISGMGKDQLTGYGLLDVEAALAADPEFFIEAEISGVEVVQEAGKTLLRVSGTAAANNLKQAWVEVGKGESPTEWKKVSRNLTKPVSKANIDDLDAGNFQGEKVWILRVVVEHENGRRREGWFRLRIG